MKKIVLAFILVFSVSYAENPINTSSDIGQWRTFVGIEGGAGCTNYYRNRFILAYTNTFSKSNGSAIGYHLALNLGWQKYLSEIVGTRLSLNFGGEYLPQMSIETDGIKIGDFQKGYGWEFGFVNDWIINFTSQSKIKFGMLLGFGLTFYDHLDFKNPSFSSMNAFLLNARFGLSTQIENSIIDLYFSIPTISLVPVSSKIDGKYYLHYTNNITLGYKHLF